MLGLITKYNMEHRRTYPYHGLATLEHTSEMRVAYLKDGDWQRLHDEQFKVGWKELRQTSDAPLCGRGRALARSG